MSETPIGYTCPDCGLIWATPSLALWDCCPLYSDVDDLDPKNAAALAHRQALADLWGGE